MSDHLDDQGDVKPEVWIDYAKAERGNYAARVRTASNVVRLEPDVEAAFPNAESLNEALRALIRASKVMTPSSH